MRFSNRVHYVFLVGASFAAILPVGVNAQEQSGASEPIEEILVTASRRQQSFVEVPSAVSVIDGAVLEERSLTDIRDFAALVPGFSIDDRGSTDIRLILRGQNTGGAGASVALMFDEVVLSSSSALSNGSTVTPNFDTYDLERVEVLRGPQGTLYGATAQGGLVKYVTKAPELTRFSGAAEAGLESVDDGETAFSARAAINLPIIRDKIALRAVGYYTELPGFIDNPLLGLKDVNAGERKGGRVSLLIKPDDRLSIRLTGAYQEEEWGAEGVVEVIGSPLVANAETQRSFDLFGRTPSDRKAFQAGPAATSQFANALVEYDLGFAQLTSSSSYVKIERRLGFDISNGPAAPGATLGQFLTPLFGEPIVLPLRQNNDHEKFNQEVRLSSIPGNGPDWLVWQIGVYHSHEDVLFDQNFETFAVADTSRRLTVLPFIPGLGGLGVGGQATVADYNEWSGFGDFTFKLTDRFEISLGGRYTDIAQDGTLTNFPGVFTGLPSAQDPTIASRLTFASSEDKFTYSIAPRYAVSDDVSIYGRVASGYRPGGPLTVPGAGQNGIPASFAPDDTVNYEVGAKGRLGPVTFDVAIYRIDWTDVQILGAVTPPGGQTVFVTTNGGNARSQGIEWAFFVEPIDNLMLSWSGNAVDAELRADAPFIGGQAGDNLPYVPEFSSAIAADYSFELSDTASLRLGGTWSYVGKRNAEFIAAPVFSNNPELPDYGVVDLRAGLDLAKFSIDAMLRNVGNSRGITGYRSAAGFEAQSGQAAIVQPRSVMLRVSTRF